MKSYRLDGSEVHTVELNNRAYLYGDGFFTTIRVFQGVPQLLVYHLKRLLHAADVLQMSVDGHAVQSALLRHAASLSQGVIKVQVYRSSSTAKRGYAPSSQMGEVVISVSDVSENVPASGRSVVPENVALPLQAPVEVALLSQRLAIQPINLAGIKSLNRIENVMAAQELCHFQQSQPAVAEGLVCSLNDYVIEGISSNLFFYSDGMWMTPALTYSGVAGTLRQAILDSYDVAVVELPLSKIGSVDAAFLCNAIRGIRPVKSIYNAVKQRDCVAQLNTQLVTQLHKTLCDNASFMAHITA